MQNPMQDLYQAQLEATRKVANIVLSSAEKMDHLALSAAKDSMNDQIKYVEALGAVRDPNGVQTIQSAFSKQTPDAMLNYYRELFKVFSESNAEIGRIAESYLEDMKAAAMKTANGAARNMDVAASAGEAAPAAEAGILGLWNAGYKQLSKMTEQYLQAANKAASVVSETVTAAAPKAKAKAKSNGSRRR
jgi:phasin family protein